VTRQEIPNNTPEQVRDYLLQALQLVEEIEPPTDLREAVFAQAAQLISGKQVVLMQPQPVDLGALRLPNSRH
jgi:hypothetical protein